MKRTAATATFFTGALCCLWQTAVADLTFFSESDVAARSFSIVAVSDVPVITVTLEVFSDVGGLVLVASATTTVESAAVPGAHANGVVKVTASGLSEESAYYVRLVVSAVGGDTVFPAGPPFYGVNTAGTPASLSSANTLRVNDLFSFAPYVPATMMDPQSVLAVLEIPQLSPTPVSSFVDANAPVASVYFDANNFLDLNGARLVLGENVDAQIMELRGLACSSPRRTRFRRTPALTAVGAPLTYKPLSSCFFADTVCDDVVDVLDFQYLLNSFGTTVGECQYSPDLDIVVDDTIDVLDMQSVLNRFGENAPFN